MCQQRATVKDAMRSSCDHLGEPSVHHRIMVPNVSAIERDDARSRAPPRQQRCNLDDEPITVEVSEIRDAQRCT
jgi:hypothetical protein